MSAATKQTLMEKLMALRSSTPEAAQALHDLFMPISFRAGMALNLGEYTFPVLYFIENGLVRGYIYYKKEEYTCWALAHGFLMAMTSLADPDQGIEYVEFVNDTQVRSLNLGRMELLAQKEPALYRMLFEILQECMQGGRIRELVLKLKFGKERFSFMAKYHKDLLYKIPHKILASLLDVTIKYLYQLKKEYKEE
jgi:hypothetical protein